MTIAAKYEDGVFKPLEEVKLTEGTRVEVHVAGQPRGRGAGNFQRRVVHAAPLRQDAAAGGGFWFRRHRAASMDVLRWNIFRPQNDLVAFPAFDADVVHPSETIPPGQAVKWIVRRPE